MELRFFFPSPLCGFFVCLFISFFSGLTIQENVLYLRMYLHLVLSHGKNHNEEVSSWEVIARVFLPVTLEGHLLRKIKLISSREHGFAT